MNIEELIFLCENRLSYLNSQLGTATALGDIQQIVRIQAEIETTAATLQKLRSLLS
jgi:hypothetical protein